MPYTPDYSQNGNWMYCKPSLPGYNSYISTSNAALTTNPLWSSRSMFDKEYLHVEVLADNEVPFNKSTDDILNMNMYTCHICDTKVPKSHAKEHNDGEKHQMFVKIADIAMERARNHMKSITKESRLSVNVTGTYFCEPCSLIVQKVDEINHELSEKHELSIKYDEVLRDFLMIYEDKDKINLVAKKHNDIPSSVKDSVELPKEIESQEGKIVPNNDALSKPTDEAIKPPNNADLPKPENVLEISSIALENVSQTSNNALKKNTINITLEKFDSLLSDMSKRLVEDITESLTDAHKTQTTTPGKKEKANKAINELAKYLKTVSEKCKVNPIHSIEALTDKLILITALNGDKIKVPVVNFHSILNQKDKSYCKICEGPNVGYRHEYSEEHMHKLMIPIEDKNAIRKIDDIWSHCVMCNDLTKNVNFHLQSLLHKNKLKHCLVESVIDINENIVQKSNPQKDTSQLIQEHSLIVSDNDSEITCNICSLTIPNMAASINNHIKAFDHITNYNNVIEQNKLNKTDEVQYYCIPCDMCVTKCFALGHCNGKKHNKNLAGMLKKEIAEKVNVENEVIDEYTQIIIPSISQQIRRISKSGSKTQNNSDLICFVCNIILYNVDTHMNSLDHKKSYLSYLESNKLNEIEEDAFYCIPCNTVILIDYLMNHCTSKKHKIHLKNLLCNAASKDLQSECTGQLIAKNSHLSRSITQSVQHQKERATRSETPVLSQNRIFGTTIPLKMLYQFREMSNASNLLCTICDEEVPYRKQEVQSHVNSIEHVVAFNLMMLWNKIKMLKDKYYCDLCKVEVTYFNELSHVTGAKHVAVMAEQPKGTVYEYDKKLLTLEYAMSHKVGDREIFNFVHLKIVNWE